MGLFSFFKSKPSTPPLPPVIPLPAQADDAFNALSAAMDAEGDPSARHRLWTAVLDLDAWHFVDFAPKGKAPSSPMLSTVSDRSCVLAYTSLQRAQIAAGHYKDTIKNTAFATLSLPRSAAIERVAQLPREKPEYVLFNAGTGGNGFSETIPSLAAMSDFFLDELPDGALHRLAQVAESPQGQTALTRLIRRLAKLPNWYFILDTDHQDIPQLIAHNKITTFSAYTSQAQLERRALAVPGLLSRPFITRPPLAAIALLAAAVNRSNQQLTQVTFNPGPHAFTLPVESLQT